VAADLLSQAEHGVDSQVVLVAINLPPSIVSEIETQVDAQARALERVEIVRESVAKSTIVLVDDLDAALAFSNDYAPEHLILHIEKAADAVSRVQNAGSVFVGPFSPERQVNIRFFFSGSPSCASLMIDRWPSCLSSVAAETTHRERIIRCRRMAMRASLAG